MAALPYASAPLAPFVPRFARGESRDDGDGERGSRTYYRENKPKRINVVVSTFTPRREEVLAAQGQPEIGRGLERTSPTCS